jgi:hypothetical protein
MLYKRRCNATQGKKKGVRRERGRERKRGGVCARRGKGMAWGDRPGRIDMGSYTLKSRSSPAPDCRFTQYGICDPTHSPFLLWLVTQLTDRDPSILQPPSQLNFFSPSLSHPLQHTRPLATIFFSSSSSGSSHCYLILSVPFSQSYPSSISPHEPYWHEAVLPTLF